MVQFRILSQKDYGRQFVVLELIPHRGGEYQAAPTRLTGSWNLARGAPFKISEGQPRPCYHGAPLGRKLARTISQQCS